MHCLSSKAISLRIFRWFWILISYKINNNDKNNTKESKIEQRDVFYCQRWFDIGMCWLLVATLTLLVGAATQISTSLFVFLNFTFIFVFALNLYSLVKLPVLLALACFAEVLIPKNQSRHQQAATTCAFVFLAKHLMIACWARLAQLVERGANNSKVVGSRPALSIFFAPFWGCWPRRIVPKCRW